MLGSHTRTLCEALPLSPCSAVPPSRRPCCLSAGPRVPYAAVLFAPGEGSEVFEAVKPPRRTLSLCGGPVVQGY